MAPPILTGENYKYWAVRMEVYMEALDIWEVVQEDYEILLPTNPTLAQIKRFQENKTKKSKAKVVLFLEVSPSIFTRIVMTLDLT
ncbi:hypothetical protein LINPERPRIM_LOCUS343 [Linum perenne]